MTTRPSDDRDRGDPPIAAIAAILAAIGGAGAVAAERTCVADDLRLRVEGVGPIRFPITRAAAEKLCAVARPAPFGKGTETILDPSVRDGLEISPRLIRIEEETWAPVLRREVASLATRLGFLEEDALEAVLDKMLVYGPGQFFLPHQDTERADDMVATLVVILPSTHRGGAVVVEHRGTKHVLEGAAPRGELALLAFYADCRHEVRPVRSGYRIALTYQLRRRARASASSSSSVATIKALEQRVADYFDTPTKSLWSGDAPKRPTQLTYLLDHEYSQKALGWHRMKGADVPRVDALREVADRIGCNIFVTLAEVHESWQCEGEELGYARGRYGRGWRAHTDDGAEPELLYLNQTEVDLRHWIDADGNVDPSMSGSPRVEAICFTRASLDFTPFKSEHEGYMGNYGDTVDRWYHRAAVVLWPKARDFSVRAQASPRWALKELRKQLDRGKVADARRAAGTLQPFWRAALAREAPTEAFVRDLVSTATALGDGALARALLEPLGLHHLTGEVRPAFGEAVQAFGAAWGEQLLQRWPEGARYGVPPWLDRLPEICAELDLAGKEGGALASWLLERQARAIEERHRALVQMHSVFREEAVGQQLVDWLSVLDAAVALGATATRDRLVALPLSGGAEVPLLPLGTLVEQIAAERNPKQIELLGLGPLFQRVVAALDEVANAPPRRPDDWSIAPPRTCKCALCAELAQFLSDPQRTRHAWPLSKERRRHVHGVIDANGLPLSHVTHRAGSPHSLVLTKQRALFDRESESREAARAMLEKLRKRARLFGGAAAAKRGRA